MYKKSVVFLSILLITALSLSACNTINEVEKNKDHYLSKIYHVVDKGEGDLENGVLSYETKSAIETNVEQSLEMEIDNEIVDLQYSETQYFAIRRKKAHLYLVDGDSNKEVLIEEDGSVRAIFYKFSKIEISEKSTPDEVLPLLESKIGKFFNISDYEYLDKPDYHPDRSDFGSYRFRYYNAVDGYITENVNVSVNHKGEIYGLTIFRFDSDITELNIDKELESDLIELKLKNMPKQDDRTYKSYDIHFTPVLVMYNDEVYVEYYVAPKYIKSGEEYSGYLEILLIPLEFMQVK
jgi:hypothetical protein